MRLCRFWCLLVFLAGADYSRFAHGGCSHELVNLYRVDNRYLQVQMVLENLRLEDNPAVRQFHLAYTPPRLALHPMRVLYGDRPFEWGGDDVISASHFTWENERHFVSPSTLELGRRDAYPPNEPPNPDHPFQRYSIDLNSGRFVGSHPSQDASAIQRWASYASICQPKGSFLVVPAACVAAWEPRLVAGSEVRKDETNRPDAWDFSREVAEWNRAYAAREAFESTLPAYSSDAHSITYEFGSPGLHIALTQRGPASQYPRVSLAEFSVEYDPSFFVPGGLVRRTFGNRPAVLTLEDVEEGPINESFARSLAIRLRALRPNDFGADLIIERDTGALLLTAPSGRGFGELTSQVVSAAQQSIGSPLVGVWKAVRDQ
jgi:hypothetical protein